MSVRLRELRPADDAALRLLFADPDTARWNPGAAAEDVAVWRERNAETSPDFVTWAVADADALVGTVAVFGVDAHRRVAEIGFRVSPAARGRGVAQAAVRLAVAQAALSLPVDRLVLFHALENVASCRVATACGFALDAQLRDNFRYGDGELHDEHRHLLVLPARG